MTIELVRTASQSGKLFSMPASSLSCALLLLPEQTLATVEVVWRDTSAAYLGLENQVEGSNGERRLNSEFRYLVKVHNSTAF